MKKLAYFLFLLVFISCQQEYVLNETITIEGNAWDYEEILSFDLDINDIESQYNLHLIVKHTEAYSYENIYMKIHTKFPTIDKKEEQITIQLADKKGDWIGKCSGENCEVKVYLLEGFKFPEEGAYSFEFEQFTREEHLTNVEGLQLQLYKVTAK